MSTRLLWFPSSTTLNSICRPQLEPMHTRHLLIVWSAATYWSGCCCERSCCRRERPQIGWRRSQCGGWRCTADQGTCLWGYGCRRCGCGRGWSPRAGPGGSTAGQSRRSQNQQGRSTWSPAKCWWRPWIERRREVWELRRKKWYLVKLDLVCGENLCILIPFNIYLIQDST